MGLLAGTQEGLAQFVVFVANDAKVQGVGAEPSEMTIGALEQFLDAAQLTSFERVIIAADHVVDLEPGAGEHGGELMFCGPTDKLWHDPTSLTARYLRDELTIPLPQKRRATQGHTLQLLGARENNLQGIDLSIPLQTLTCVTGVSGSGKSTLVHDTLYHALECVFHGSSGKIGTFDRIVGVEYLRDVILLDQQPIGKTPRQSGDLCGGVWPHPHAVRPDFQGPVGGLWRRRFLL